MEKWKAVKEYEGRYEVSNEGRVRRADGKIMRHWTNHWGYQLVQLWKNGVGKHHSIHRLVAEAFVDNPMQLPQVNHKDENRANNRADNLEWCTAQYNINYGRRNERTAKALTNNPLRSRGVRQYTKNGEFIREYPSMHEAERCTGVQPGSIWYSAKHNGVGGGYRWEYVNGEGK